MALERHNPVDEFDTNFRRHLQQHLKQRGAPVAPCVGFDTDAASAYLERALSVQAHAQFERHLADCATCRRRLIGLARLSDELEMPVAKSPVVAIEPVWSRWYSTVAQWFDFADWNRGWTAATVTACGLLLTVLAATTWQQLSVPQNMQSAVAVNSPSADALVAQTQPERVVVPDAQVSARPESEIASGNSVVVQVAALPAMQSGQAGQAALAGDARLVQIPLPKTPHPALSAPNPGLLIVAAPPEAKTPGLEINDKNVGAPPAPIASGSAATLVGFSAPNSSLALPISLSSRQTAREPSRIALQLGDSEKKEIFANLELPEPRRESEGAAKTTANERATNDPAAAARARQLAHALKGRAFGFMPLSNAEARTKEADVKEAKEQLKPLMKHLNGHTFYFERGFWIDEAYTSDTTLPLIRLTRGDARYQQILIENPTLEQFFQLGQVIVVWKGKIYEVRKQ